MRNITLVGLTFFFLIYSWAGQTRLKIDFDLLHATVAQSFNAVNAEKVRTLEALIQTLEGSDTKVQMRDINDFFANNVSYQTDDILFKKKDYWATPAELLGHGLGDCEDYAIAKYVMLLNLGIPESKLRLIYVKAKIGRSRITQAHMVLGYYEQPNSEPLILDSLVSGILPASKRTDLIPVFSFNTAGLWTPGSSTPREKSSSRLSRWQNVIERMKTEGIAW